MNINLEKHDIDLILDALEDYKSEIKYWAGHPDGRFVGPAYSETDVENLVNYLSDTLEKK